MASKYKLKIERFDIWKVVSLVLAGLLVVSLLANTQDIKLFRSGMGMNLRTGNLLVSAAEIYPLFFCPCCGQPLDKGNICCGQAEERIGYIDSLVSEKKSEKEIILAYVKRYGVNSFVDKNKTEEIKEELLKTAPVDRPIISSTPEIYDFGDVSEKKGKVFTSFTLKNEGKSDLVISKLDTSCGCTFASIIFAGSQSPFFTMPGHGSKNPSWEGLVIPPGKEAELKVMYDPHVHKDFRGAATREIYIYSNDPVDFEKKVIIELNQID